MVVGSGASLSTTGTGAIAATTASSLAANGANCATGQFAQGVSASGAAEGCTALPTSITGTANQIDASASTGTITLGIANNPTLPGITSGTFNGNLTGNASTATSVSFGGVTAAAANTATLQVGNGGSLAATGTGTITATNVKVFTTPNGLTTQVAHIVAGRATATGTTLIVTLSNGAAFTSSTSYQCSLTANVTGSFTLTYNSGTQFTIGATANNEVYSYMCIGN